VYVYCDLRYRFPHIHHLLFLNPDWRIVLVTETRQETSHEVRLDLTDLMLLSPKNPFMAYKYTGEPDSRPFFFLRVFVGMYSVFSNQSSLIKKVRKADAQTMAGVDCGRGRT
jgi:hypothetical protein